MFMMNSDSTYCYFNGKNLESPLKYELIGTLMGLAPRNLVLINVPLIQTCYKALLEKPLDLSDLKKWDENVYRSFQYILSYEDEDALEDILCTTFTIDYKNL